MSIQSNINNLLSQTAKLYAIGQLKGEITDFKSSTEQFHDLITDAKNVGAKELVKNTKDTRNAEISEDEVIDRDMTPSERRAYESALKDPKYKQPFGFKGVGAKMSDLWEKIKDKGRDKVNEVNLKSYYPTREEDIDTYDDWGSID